jgi:hypothetical protein
LYKLGVLRLQLLHKWLQIVGKYAEDALKTKQNKTLFDSSDKKNTPKMLLIAVNIHNRKEIK